jgi:hypothetical protein
VLKRSTLAHMRLALALAAAGAAAASSSSLIGCGKEEMPATTAKPGASQNRSRRTVDRNEKTPLAGKDAGPPVSHDCDMCGMG